MSLFYKQYGSWTQSYLDNEYKIMPSDKLFAALKTGSFSLVPVPFKALQIVDHTIVINPYIDVQ
jgi:hypothetical protein